MVFGIALRYTRCRDDAQDVLQETFIKAFEKRESFNPEYPIAPWLKKIAINAALQYARKNYKFILIENEEKFERAPEDEMTKESLSELKRRLLAVLNQLPDGYRVVFNLFVIDNLTHKEIAEYLTITESTSRSQLHKAKKMISRILEKENI